MFEAPPLSGFEAHDLTHSSASQINLFAAAPYMWVSQYLFGKRTPFGAAAKSGVLVEEAIVNVLVRGFTEEQATQSAIDEYNKFTALHATDSEVKRGAAMPGMISLGLAELKQYGDPEFDGIDQFGKLQQKKVEIFCNGSGWRLAIIGFIDLYFPKHGKIIDLKSTMKLPSEMSDSHLRQACIYKTAKEFSNQDVEFLYLTGKKSQKFICPPTADTLGEIKTILNRQEEMLRGGTKEQIVAEIRKYIPHEPNTFYHDNTIVRELYGI